MTTNNPWRGLAAYKDPQNTTREYKFCGRYTETYDLIKLIDNNIFVTLYGRSGVGKTSLLNAGVFPVLRQQNYYPIYIRLAQESADITYAKAIINKIRSSGITEHRTHCDDENGDARSITYLWHYFATTNFEDTNGNKTYPIIVLDQFEEIFFQSKEEAGLLLQQIYTLLNDDLAIPDEKEFKECN